MTGTRCLEGTLFEFRFCCQVVGVRVWRQVSRHAKPEYCLSGSFPDAGRFTPVCAFAAVLFLSRLLHSSIE
jgi:hypothetical protein